VFVAIIKCCYYLQISNGPISNVFKNNFDRFLVFWACFENIMQHRKYVEKKKKRKERKYTLPPPNVSHIFQSCLQSEKTMYPNHVLKIFNVAHLLLKFVFFNRIRHTSNAGTEPETLMGRGQGPKKIIGRGQ
jgi:hypothetical protein